MLPMSARLNTIYVDLSFHAMNTYCRPNPTNSVFHGVPKRMKVFLVRFYIVLVFAGGWMAQLFSLLPKLALLLLCLMSPVLLHAETMAGTVLDPSGAVIVGARIEITGGELTQPIVLSSDAQGKFVSPDLKPGS